MDQEKVEQLKKFDTASITNVVATYPNNKDMCLGLYHPWRGEWYTDQSLKCMFPELGRCVGHAVTCVYGPAGDTYNRLGMTDLLNALKKSPEPIILIAKQNLPDEIKKKSGLYGGNLMTAFRSFGVVGVLSDGPSRDIDEVRALKMQYMLTGVTPGHGEYTIEAVNIPVNVCGMSVAPGDIIHMDENGAVKFPEEYIDEIIIRTDKLLKAEAMQQAKMRETTDVEEMVRIISNLNYNCY